MSHKPLQLVGKVVVITGASSGIGAESMRAFAKRGAHVVGLARTRSTLEARVGELTRDGLSAQAAAIDVTDAGAVKTLFEELEQQHGGIDVLVNNAAINHRGPFEELSMDQLRAAIATNLLAPATLMRLVLPYMRKRGRGAIVNVASLAGRVPLIYESHYCATKFALRGLSFAVADELMDSGITVSVVSPGPVSTGFIMSDIDSVSDMVFSQPMSSPAEIAQLILRCAVDGKLERVPSWGVRITSTLGYLFPSLRRLTTPLLMTRGRAMKERYRGKLPTLP